MTSDLCLLTLKLPDSFSSLPRVRGIYSIRAVSCNPQYHVSESPQIRLPIYAHLTRREQAKSTRESLGRIGPASRTPKRNGASKTYTYGYRTSARQPARLFIPTPNNGFPLPLPLPLCSQCIRICIRSSRLSPAGGNSSMTRAVVFLNCPALPRPALPCPAS